MYVNKSKLSRARANVGLDAPEEMVRAEYERLGGLYVEAEVEEKPKVVKKAKKSK